MLQPDREDRRMFNVLTIFALLIRCPVGEAGKGKDCPFAEFRDGFGLEKKFLIAENLSEEKCREMLGFHDSCLADACRNQKITTAV